MKNTVRIDCIGDSITSGIKPPSYPRVLRGLFHENGFEGIRVSNRGKEGFSVGHYLEYLQTEPNKSRWDKVDLDMVILQLGTNDTRDTLQTPLKEFTVQYRQLIEFLQNKTDHIYMTTIPWYDAPVKIHWQDELHTFDGVDRIENELNPALQSLADEMDCTVIDIHHPLKEQGTGVFLDGIHPNPTGNQIIAKTCYQSLLPTVKQVS